MKSAVVLLFLLCATQLRADVLPRQESESQWVTDHIRTYYTTTENGEKRLVITNLDQSGKRIDPPVKIETTKAPRYSIASAPRVQENDEYPEYERYERFPRYQRSYFDTYYSPGWIPDYPGSSFGFHLFPQFFVIHPQRTPGFHAARFQPWRRFR